MVKVLKEMYPKGSFRWQKTDGFKLDGYLKSNLDYVKQNVMKQNYDSFIIISGREGYGKSTLGAQIAIYLDPTYTLDRCTFTAEQFEEACDGAKKFQAVVFDETMGYLSSRGAMSKFNRGLIKIMSEMRSKNLFVIMCIPSFFELDKYPALHRSTGLLHIKKRGRFLSYDYETKKKLYLLGKKFYNLAVPPNFYGDFNKFIPYNMVEYEKKKQRSIRGANKMGNREKRLQEQRDNIIRELHKKNPELNMGEIGEKIDLSQQQISYILAKHKEKGDSE